VGGVGEGSNHKCETEGEIAENYWGEERRKGKYKIEDPEVDGSCLL